MAEITTGPAVPFNFVVKSAATAFVGTDGSYLGIAVKATGATKIRIYDLAEGEERVESRLLDMFTLASGEAEQRFYPRPGKRVRFGIAIVNVEGEAEGVVFQ